MSDLFDEFVFDLQRFDTAKYSEILGYSSSASSATTGYYWPQQQPLYLFDEDGAATVKAANATITFSLSGTTRIIGQVTAVTPDESSTGMVFSDTGSGSAANAIYFKTGGGLSFGMKTQGSNPQSVTFNEVGEQVTLNDKALEYFGSGSAINFQGTNFEEKLEGFDLGSLTENGTDESLEVTDAQGEFKLDSLAADTRFNFLADLAINFAGSSTDGGPSYFGNATKGGNVVFNLDKDLNITVDEGGVVLVGTEAMSGGISNANGITVNGAALNLGVTGFAYDNMTASKPILYLTDEEFGENVSEGDGDSDLESQLRVFTIGSSSATVKGLSKDYSGFILNKDKEIQGFVFAKEDEAATLILNGTIPEGFSIYAEGYDDSATPVVVPTVQDDDGIAAIKKSTVDGEAQLALIVDAGATVTDKNGTEIVVSGAGASYVSVFFDPTTGKILGVMPAANPTGSEDAPTDFASGWTFNVSMSASTYGKVYGLSFGGADVFNTANAFVAVGSGKFTYKKGSVEIVLGETADTVFAVDSAEKVVVASGEGKLVDATDGDDTADGDPTYTYNNASGSAYFKVNPSAAEYKLSSFVFAGVSDALTIDSNVPATFGLSFIGANNAETAFAEKPNVSASSYTVEMTAEYDETTKVAEFAVDNFSESGTTIQFGGGSFVFGTQNDEFFFNSGGSAIGFNAEDTVTMDQGAAKFLEGGSFAINGESVDIVAVVGEDGLLYNASDSSLFGLSSGTDIKDAGGITKVYASKDAGNFKIGSASYTFNAAGESVGDRAFFNVSGSTATGFTFVKVDDQLKVTAAMQSGFSIADKDNGAIDTPEVYGSDDNPKDEYTLTKIADPNYAISDFEEDDYAKVGTGTVTFETLVGDSAAIIFNAKTVAITGVSYLTAGDAVGVEGISTALNLDGETVEIDSSRYLFTKGAKSSTITEVEADAIIKQIGSASYIGTAAGESGIGSYEFAVSGQSFIIASISKADVNGVNFMIGGGSIVNAITDINDGEVVIGTESTFDVVENVNGKEFDVKGADVIGVIGNSNASKLSEIAVKGSSVDVKAVAGASFVTTYQVDQISFAGASAFTLAGGQRKDIIFGIDDKLVVNSISGVEAVESVSGYFDGVEAVNGVSFAVDDDNEIMIVGKDDNDGISKIAKVSGGASIANVGGASQVVTDTDGEFYFAGNSTFSVTGDTSVVFQMDTTKDALVEGVTDFGNAGTSATLAGMLQGLTINGSSAAIVIDDDSDSVFKYMVDATGSNATLGGVGGASVVYIKETAGASFVQTDAAGTFVFVNSGQSFTTDDDSLTFKVVDGVVTEIYGLNKDNQVTGNFDSLVSVYGESSLQGVQVDNDKDVKVYYDELLLKDISDLATIQRADGIVEAWTDPIAAGSSIQVTDGDGHTFVVAASASDANGVMFALDGENPAHIRGVSSLAQSATLGGDLGVLTAVNGQSFGVKEVAQSYGGDGVFSVVGSEGGIGEIVGLGGSVAIFDAGGASIAKTDANAFITFKDGNEFFVGGSGVKPEVDFALKDSNAIAIAGISSNELVMGSGSAFEDLAAVNGQPFDVQGASALAVVGNEKSNGLTGIAVFGGSNVVVSAAASAIFVDAVNVNQITFGESSTSFLMAASGIASIDFNLKGLDVVGVSAVSDVEVVIGDFTDVDTVNGKTFDVQNDKNIAVVGNENQDGLTVIAFVSDSAVINDVGGASQVITDTEGEFTFAGGNSFIVLGDSSVAFQMVEGAAASVAGITDFATDGESAAMVIGKLNGLYINAEDKTIDVEGDADDVLAYAKQTYEGEDYYALAVGGSAVTVKGAASATFIAATEDGKYTFAMDKADDPTTYTVGGDSEIVFEVEGNKVVGIYDMEKDASVTGDFSNVVSVEGIAADGTVEEEGTVQITGDPSVTVVYDEFEVRELSNGASISSATSFKHAYTDGAASAALTITDASGDEFTVENDPDGVHYLLNGEGEIVGVDDLDDGATLKGSLGALSSINGKDFRVTEIATGQIFPDLPNAGDGKFAVVGASNGIGKIVELGGIVTVTDGGGASKLVTNDNVFLSTGGQSFIVSGIKDVTVERLEDVTPSTDFDALIDQLGQFNDKSDGVEFSIDENDVVTAVNGLSGNEIIESAALGGISINGKGLQVEGANIILAQGTDDEDGISALVVGSGSKVVVDDAAGASVALAIDVDEITFGEDTFTIDSTKDYPAVGFGLSGVDVKTVGLLDDKESLSGNFNDISSVNDADFDVKDADEIMVVGSENVEGITKIAKVSDGAEIGNVGGASQVITDTEGEFTFAGGNSFIVLGDSSVAFQMVEDAAASVAGITDFATDGESAAMVIGKLNGLYINAEDKTIDVEGDADDVLAYAKQTYEGEDYYALAVGGSAVTINNAASATFIETTDGKYTFAMDKADDPTTYTVGGDSEIVFEVDGNKVVGIYDMEKDASVTGDFSNVVSVEGIAADGTVEEEGTVQITGDPSVTVVYDEFEVRELSNGASISSATSFKHAYTDGVSATDALTVTDADGDEFTVENDADGVHYLLDGKGNIIGVDDLDEGATIKGDLGELKSVNGAAFDVKEEILNYGGLSSGDGQFAIVGGSNGIGSIVELGGKVTVKDGGGASKFATNDNIFITSGGDQYVVAALKELSPEQLEGITPSTVAAELIKQIAPYVIESDGVEFVTDGKDVVTAINGLSGNELIATFAQSLVGGDFPINGQPVNIEGNVQLIAAQGTNDEDGISALIVGSSSNVVVNKAAGAYGVLALDVDQIAFGSASAFTITSDKDIPGVGFGLSKGTVNVDSVALLDNKESVSGYFNDISSVNDSQFDVTDSNEIMVVGNEKVDGVSKVANVSDGAVIAKVGGASQVITDTDGTFTFTNSNQVFEVHDTDKSATFDMNGNDVANVNLDFGVAISDNKQFANVSVNGALVDIKGDEGTMAIGALSSDGIDLVANLGSASGVTVNNAGGASYIGTDKQGNFTFTKDGRAFEVGGDSQVVFVLDADENVTAVIGANKGTSVTGDFTKAVAFAGLSSETATEFTTATVQIANDADVMVVHDGFEVRMLSNGASISSATTVEKAYTDAANLAPLTVIDADGDEFTVYGDADGVMYSLDGAGEIIAVDGLDEGATLGGAIGHLKSINGKDFDIVEKVNTYHGQTGDGVFSVVGGESASGISKVIGLGGNVSVNNAGGATELVTNDEIVLRANDKRLHIRNDSSVTFGVSGVNDIVSLTEFGGMSNATAILDANSAGINGLEINGKGAVSVVGDGNDKVIFKDENGDATLTGIDNLNDSEGATIYSTAYADKVKTSGDGLYNFYGKQEFLVMGEGEGGNRSADAAKNSVWYDVANDSVTAISSLNGSIASDFTTAISVNGEQIQVLGDSGVIVVGTGSVDSAATNVSAIEAVNSGATVVSWGSASHVGVFNDDGTLSNYQFIGADKQTQAFIANDTNDSIFSFTTDKNKVTGVADLDDGGIAFNPNQTNALDVNTADYPAQSLTFASTESITGFNVADRYVVAAAGINGSISGIIAPSATVYGVDGDSDININGKDIFVADDDDQFNVVVHDATPDYVYDVDGDATVLAESVSVRANSAGTDTNPTKDTYVIGGESYIFDDSKDENDGFTFVTDSNGTMNKVASLEGALVINDGEWAGTINGDEFEVIDYPNNVNPPVTVNSGASGIESVGGLDHKDTVNGDLGKAQVHIPGYGEEGGKYPATTITINGKPYTVVTDPDGVDVTGDDADVITDLDNQASLIGAEGEVTVNGTELEPEEGDVIKGDRADNSHARIVGDDELIRQATAINHYNHQGYDLATDATTAAAFNIEDVVGLPTYTGATTPAYLDRDDTDAINAGSSAIDFNQPLIVSLWNFADGEFQKDEQVFDMSSYSYTKKVYMNGDGPQAVKFNNAGGNLAVVADDATGVKNVSLGSGGDAVVMDEDYALQNAVYIYGGVGDDSVFVRHSANTYVNFSAGGEDILVTAGEANARVTIDGYNASTGAAIRVEEYLDVENQKAGTVAQGIENGIISFAEGTVIITSDEGRSEVSVGTNGYGGQIVNLMTHVTSGNDSLQAVGFTGSDGGVVDGSSFQSPLIMIGNDDNTKTAGSSLVGGLANDTFYAGADDTVEVGYGNDYVSLFNDSLRSGAYVDIGYGRATIDGMNNTLADSTGDVISVAIDPNDATFSLLYNDTLGTLAIESSADGYYALLTDVDTLEGNYTTQYIYDSNADTLYSVAIGTVGSTIKVTEDQDLRPDVFFGYQTAIDFREYTGDAIIDLRGDMAESIIDEKIVIIDDDVNTLYAGIGDTALKGDLDDETFFAGKGNTWIYGDGGKNLLVGYDNTNNDKEGQTVFYVLGNEDGAAHTIAGFNYVTDDNFTDTKKVTADALEFDLDDNNITRIDISGNDLVFEITDKAGNDTESALLLDAINADGTGKDFIVSDNIAQVAEDTLVFDQFADYYYATGKNATVEVSGRIEDDVVLWLDEDETGKVFEGDIHVIDARNSDATAQLAGNENDNVIFAGTGETSLWGGEGGNDLLVGNAGGRDTFYYSFGNGDDTITNVKDGDVIALDVSLDQIDEIDMSDATAIRIIMNDGDVLTINDAGHDLNVMIDNGEDGTDTYSTREARSRQ